MVLIYTFDTLIPPYFESSSKKKFLAYISPTILFTLEIQKYYQKIHHSTTKGSNCFIHAFIQNDSNQML